MYAQVEKKENKRKGMVRPPVDLSGHGVTNNKDNSQLESSLIRNNRNVIQSKIFDGEEQITGIPELVKKGYNYKKEKAIYIDKGKRKILDWAIKTNKYNYQLNTQALPQVVKQAENDFKTGRAWNLEERSNTLTAVQEFGNVNKSIFTAVGGSVSHNVLPISAIVAFLTPVASALEILEEYADNRMIHNTIFVKFKEKMMGNIIMVLNSLSQLILDTLSAYYNLLAALAERKSILDEEHAEGNLPIEIKRDYDSSVLFLILNDLRGIISGITSDFSMYRNSGINTNQYVKRLLFLFTDPSFLRVMAGTAFLKSEEGTTTKTISAYAMTLATLMKMLSNSTWIISSCKNLIQYFKSAWDTKFEANNQVHQNP